MDKVIIKCWGGSKRGRGRRRESVGEGEGGGEGGGIGWLIIVYIKNLKIFEIVEIKKEREGKKKRDNIFNLKC